MDIAIYARVSTDRQETRNQLAQLREFAAKQGWHIKREYVDIASGKSGDREQFGRLFEAASKRQFDLVLFWALDRFSREGVLETLQYLQRLTSYGVGYRSYTEQYLDSCGIFKEALIGILSCLARQERVRLVTRTLAGLARARSEGRIGGRPKLNCDYAKIMSLHKGGMSFGQIAKQMSLTKTTVFRIVRKAEGAQ